MIQQAINKVTKRLDLDRDEMAAVIGELADGVATPSQIGALLAALRTKGESVEEIAGAAQVMRERAVKINVTSEVFVDTCGTGGDGKHTFNISTAAAFVVAGAGVTVAKHGNRSVSSRCGSADVLLTLGVEVELEPRAIERCIQEVGIGFLFAPALHPAFKAVAAVRRELGVRTVFNILGPLANPAGARHQVLGVYDEDLVLVFARVLAALGSARAFVVSGDGFDEISLTGKTKVAEVEGETVSTYELAPEDLGLTKVDPQELLGGDVEHNARILREVLAGQKGARRDVVLANAAAALVAAGAAKGWREGVSLAARSIDSGAAAQKLADLVKASGRK